MDALPELVAFGKALETASLETLNNGILTKDLVGLAEPGIKVIEVPSEEFIDTISMRLSQKWL